MKKIIYLLGIAILFSGLFMNYDVAQMKAKPAINRKKVTLTVGEKSRLKVKNCKKKVKWKSSRKKVATVSSKGVVKAKKAGKAKITAKAGKKKYVCRVTVKAKSGKKSTKNNTAASYAEKVLQLVNKERKKAGVEPLQLDTSLCSAAATRAKEITTVFDHTRPNGDTCFSILKEKNISYRAAGENIAAGQTTPEDVVKSWMNSPGHRENILSGSFHKLGVGYVKTGSSYKHYWVQMFTD